MKKKNILSLTVLSSLMAIAGFSSFNRVSADSVGVHAAETTSTTMPTGWEASGVTADNTISPYKDPVQGNSILLKRTVAEGVLKARSTLTAVKPNTYYNFSVNAKTTDASQLKIRVIEYKDGVSALKATEVIKVTTVTGDWLSRPGMLKTTAETNGAVIEIEATGTGEVYASKLFVHEGVAPTGVMTGRTKYFESTPSNPDAFFAGRNQEEIDKELLDIKSDVLASDSATGYSAMKLTAGRGVYLKFDDYKITGKYILRFKYKYAGADGNTELIVKLDGVTSAGKRIYAAEPYPKGGWTPHGLWDSYEFEFSAQAGVAEPIFVAPYARLKAGTTSSTGYYLIDDVEVLDEKGNNLVEDGGFELKENATVNTMGYATMPEGQNETVWNGNFGSIPSSAYIYDGYNGSKAIHLESKKSLGIALPLLPNDDSNRIFTLSFKYRTTEIPTHFLKIDGFYTNNERMYYAAAGTSLQNTNGNWVTTSYEFKTRNNAATNNATSTEFMIFNAVTPIDLDDISIKDAAGNEYVYGGNFETIYGGASYKNNAGAYIDEKGNVVYSSLKYLTNNADATDSYLSINLQSLGIDTSKAGTTYSLSYEYLGGVDWGCASASDGVATWIQGTQKRSVEWKAVAEKTFEIKHKDGYSNQEVKVYGNNFWSADPKVKDSKNCYIRNISIKDSEGNEYFHPFANGTSILPQGSFRDEAAEDKKAVDEFVANYITAQMGEDYTAIPEADRAGKCQNKLKAAEGAYKRLTKSQKDLFDTSPDYAAARTAMDMWRTVSSKTSIGIFGGNAASNSTTILVCTLLAVSAVAITGFVLIRKKKHN